ncbi:carboxymuconolactone decarboxylase [Rhodococcus ruber BKS 20-38]|uniref:Carboxymuconolactone decarboxylase n=1 Tax=Rhodococcus ruber BKS 20-38 TaxID=1278076 RepID=M2Y3T0_9NOCA|nr:carboxymuconolactone decarboxylase family protein [Rhodococcus ruber]EME56250.1 carboxymuconolactone decarboxylase [Rhodococcus ruber BKS 20-38]
MTGIETGNMDRDGRIGARISKVFGDVSRQWRWFTALDSASAEAFSEFLDAAYGSGDLPPHIRELLLLAHDASVTVRDSRGVELRVRRALDAGASRREVLDVLLLLPFVALHGVTEGLPLVYDVETYDVPAATEGPYWAPFEAKFPGVHGMLAEELPDFFDAYRLLGRVVWERSELAPKWRELVLVVADMSTTHLFSRGAALHVENALRYGATRREVAAALALTAVFANTAVELGIAALESVEEAGRAQPPAH